jgi:deoxyribose-phosphate aldolase
VELLRAAASPSGASSAFLTATDHRVQALRDRAGLPGWRAEIDMVVNLGKALGGDWDYVERDIRTVCEEAHRHGAKVKVISRMIT